MRNDVHISDNITVSFACEAMWAENNITTDVTLNLAKQRVQGPWCTMQWMVKNKVPVQCHHSPVEQHRRGRTQRREWILWVVLNLLADPMRPVCRGRWALLPAPLQHLARQGQTRCLDPMHRTSKLVLWHCTWTVFIQVLSVECTMVLGFL